MPETSIQNDARRSHSPLTRCKTTEHHINDANTTRCWMQRRCCNGPAAFSPRSRGGDRLRHNPHDWRRMRDFPLSALRPSLEEDAQPPNVAPPPNTSTETSTLTMRRRLRLRCTTTRRPLPQMIRYSPLAVSEGDPASCARLCIHSVTMRAARGSSTAQARVRGGGPAASF